MRLMIKIFQILELVGLVRLCHNGKHVCRSPDLIGLQIEKMVLLADCCIVLLRGLVCVLSRPGFFR